MRCHRSTFAIHASTDLWFLRAAVILRGKVAAFAQVQVMNLAEVVTHPLSDNDIWILLHQVRKSSAPT